MDDGYLLHAHAADGDGVVTGKPINIGGSRGRREATGRGVMIVCDEASRSSACSRESTPRHRAGIRQCGLECRAADASRRDTKFIGIAEVGGGLYNKNGIDWNALVDFRQKNGTVHGFPEAEAADPAELLTDGMRNPDSRGDRKRNHQPQRRPREVPHSGGRRQRPDHIGSRRCSHRQGRVRDSRYSRECRRRDHFVL